MKRILIIGATSAVAKSVVRLYAQRQHSLYLLGRDSEHLQSIAQDARVRGAKNAQWGIIDARDVGNHKQALQVAHDALGGFDVVLIAHGVLPDQHACETDWNRLEEAIMINGTSVLSFMIHSAVMIEAQNTGGTIAVVSSVAGDRGRQSNYVYGTAKAMVSTFAQGLRNRLYRKGIKVLTIKPGLIDTPMTADLKKGMLFASPERVGKDIYRAIEKGKDVIYTPRMWRGIMRVVRCIPERIFKRLTL